MRKKKTGVISTIFLILILLVGLSVMLYPTISDWWNSKVQTRAIASYSQAVEELDDGEAELLLQQAKDYNKDLYNLPAPFTNCDQLSAYDSLLNISGKRESWAILPFLSSMWSCRFTTARAKKC